MVLSSLIMFLILYTLLLFVWIYILDKEIKHGPKEILEMSSSAYPKREKRLKKLTDRFDPS